MAEGAFHTAALCEKYRQHGHILARKAVWRHYDKNGIRPNGFRKTCCGLSFADVLYRKNGKANSFFYWLFR